jgi:hypothetical protein
VKESLKKDLKETRLGEGGWTGFIWLKTATITMFFLNMVMNMVLLVGSPPYRGEEV